MPIICVSCLLMSALARPAMDREITSADITAKAELASRIWECHLDSRVLGQRKRFVVVLPETYRTDGRPWPVVYWLHGAGRHCRSLIDKPATRKALLEAPFVTVHPDGGGGWWVDSPVKPESRYQSYVTEVVRTVEANFNVETRPARRGLGGWSMGGYGATLYAQAHPGQFGAIATILPLLDFPNPALPKEQNHSIPGVLGRSPDTWQHFNPIRAAEKLEGTGVYHVTGNDAFDRTMNENFDRELTRLGIPHTFVKIPGAHTWSVVERALPDALAFLAEKVIMRNP